MEKGRMVKKKYREEVSPERSKVWTEKSPKYQQKTTTTTPTFNNNNYYNNNNHIINININTKPRKAAVVYYLCRNRQLDHPHFIEVTFSSSHGLFLRDVIERLNVLRGRGMASMYSWSSKRRYKNGFVWHDLCEDDLILPSHGNEYILKGSELFGDSCNSDRFAHVGSVKIQNLKQLPEPPASSRSLQDDSSSSSSMNGKDAKNSEDDLSPPFRCPGSAGMSPESGVGKNCSWNGSLSLTEYKVYKSDRLAHASTQTEEVVSECKSRETCIRGVSTDEGLLQLERGNGYQMRAGRVKENSEISENSVSPPPSSSSASSSGGMTDTLESVIRADGSKINSFRIFEEEEVQMPTNARLRASNILMQLISCGSISVKDHSFKYTPTYKPRFFHSKFSSPLFSKSFMLGELDCLSENPRLMSLRLEDKEYFSGSVIETKIPKEGGDGSTLKRSSSCNADRRCTQLDPVEDVEEPTSGLSKCIPRSIKVSLSKQPRSESIRSPVSDKPRSSSDGPNGYQVMNSSAADGGSQRITETCSCNKQSKKLESFREDERVIKIEESLLQELGL